MATSLEEILISVWRLALVEGAETIMSVAGVVPCGGVGLSNFRDPQILLLNQVFSRNDSMIQYNVGAFAIGSSLARSPFIRLE
jgi:hypothetical protein